MKMLRWVKGFFARFFGPRPKLAPAAGEVVCPFVPRLLCQTIEVGRDEVKSLKVAYDDDGNAHVVAWRNFLVLEEALEWSMSPVVGPNREGLTVTAGLIDEGMRTFEVRRACLVWPMFRPLKMRGGIQTRQIMAVTEMEVSGERLPIYHAASDAFEAEVQRMLSWSACRALHVPRHWEEVSREIRARELRKRSDGKGRVRWEWIQTGPAGFRDCLLLAECVRFIKTGTREDFAEAPLTRGGGMVRPLVPGHRT